MPSTSDTSVLIVWYIKMKANEFIVEEKQMSAMDVLHDILGGQVTDSGDDEDIAPGMYVVSRPWVSGMKDGMFSTMDMEPGQGGAIGLPNPRGTSPRDIAAAAHEGSHAWLHMNGKDSNDEELVNKLASTWLRKHTSGIFLHQALEHILGSKIHYGHN